MNYYLLSLINDFGVKEKCEEIAICISSLVDSPNLKSHHTHNQLLFFFGSEIEKSEIFEHIRAILYGLVDTFVLTEIVDEFTVLLPKNIKEHLFDLENLGENTTMKINMVRIKDNLDFSFEDEDYDDDDDDELFKMNTREFNFKFQNMIPPDIPEPTLDQLLDKLYSEGMNSLSVDEKNLLKTYSQN